MPSTDRLVAIRADNTLPSRVVTAINALIAAYGGGGSSITVQEEGTPLSTAATILNFVGAKVTATGTGATKTITVATPTNSDVGAIGYCIEVSGAYPNRPASTAPVIFMGPDQPATGGTTAGGTPAAVNGLDKWFVTA